MDTLKKINNSKYLTLVPTNESKEKTKKYEGIYKKIKDLIRSVTKNSNDCDEKYMKTKFKSDGELNKTIEISSMTILSASFLRGMSI